MCIGIVSMVGLAPPWLFCSDICRSKLSSQNPSELRVFMAAGNTAGKISLVQITSPFSSLRDFLYGTFKIIIVWTCFYWKFHTISRILTCIFTLMIPSSASATAPAAPISLKCFWWVFTSWTVDISGRIYTFGIPILQRLAVNGIMPASDKGDAYADFHFYIRHCLHQYKYWWYFRYYDPAFSSSGCSKKEA